MIFLAKCADGNTFQVIYDEGKLRVESYSDMGIMPFEFIEDIEEGETSWAAPGVRFLSADRVRYFVKYLDELNLVRETQVLEMTPVQ